MSKFNIELQIEEDEILTDYSNANAFLKEVEQLQQKYNVICEVSMEPFENISFIDLKFIIDEDFAHSSFVYELEELMEESGVKYVYKQIKN